MTLVKFNNGHKQHAVNPWFSDVFDAIVNDSFINDKLQSKIPAVNIAETENEFHIELAAPGLKKEDFKISLDKKVLSVSVEKKTESTQTKLKNTANASIATNHLYARSPYLKLLDYS
jgi:HSP20 family protein